MPDDIAGFIQLALGVIAIASIAAAALGIGTIKLLRERLADADAEVQRVKDSRAEDLAEHLKYRAEAEAELVEARSDRDALRRTVTGEVHLVALGERLEDALRILTLIWDFLTKRKDKT